MPPGELLRIGDEEELEDIPRPRMYSSSHPSLPEHIAPLLPPPPFEGTATRKPPDRSLLNEKEKSVRSTSYPVSDLEDSKVFTTRRVRVQELGSRSPQDDDSTNTQPVAGPGSWSNSSVCAGAGLNSRHLAADQTRAGDQIKTPRQSSLCLVAGLV
jgi:hypothetical protein